MVLKQGVPHCVPSSQHVHLCDVMLRVGANPSNRPSSIAQCSGEMHTGTDSPRRREHACHIHSTMGKSSGGGDATPLQTLELLVSFCVLSNCMHGCPNIWNQTLHLELRLVHCPTPKNRLPPGSVNHASCCDASGRLHANSHGVYTAHIHAHMATHHRRHMNPNKPQCVCMHLAD